MKDSADTYELRAIEQRTEEGDGNLMESFYELKTETEHSKKIRISVVANKRNPKDNPTKIGG